MNKKIIKICTVVFVMIMGLCVLYKPYFVNAETKKTYVIELPGKEVSYLSYEKHLTFAQDMLISLIEDASSDADWANNRVYYVNNSGKRVLVREYLDNTTKYTLYDGATADECVFEITDEIRNTFISNYGEDPYREYDYVKLVLVQDGFEAVNGFSNPLIIDLSQDSVLDILTIDVHALEVIMYPDFLGLTHTINKVYYDMNGKVLFQLNRDTSVLEMGDVSSADDIILTLTDEDKDLLLSNGYGEMDYNYAVLKLGSQNYDSSYYVVDPTTGDTSLLWLFIDKGLVKLQNFYQYYADDGHLLFEIESHSYMIKMYEDFSYIDNMTFDISNNESLLEFMSDKLDIEGVDTIIFKYDNPEFIEGEGQISNPDEGDSLSFRLNIPFDKFLAGGEVQIDGKVVDSSKYDVSEGSTIITFKKDYANGLSNGDHTITVSVPDGEASAPFSIVEKSPATGDHLFLYLGLLAASFVGLFVVRKRLS